MIPRKPFLLRAMVEWAEANAWTPLIVVDAEAPGVQVPRAYVEDGRITLNVSFSALNQRQMSNEAVSGYARFGGNSEYLDVPIEAVNALVVRETGEGMVFPEEADMSSESASDDEPASDLRPVDSGQGNDRPDADDEPPRPPRGKPSLKLVK